MKYGNKETEAEFIQRLQRGMAMNGYQTGTWLYCNENGLLNTNGKNVEDTFVEVLLCLGEERKMLHLFSGAEEPWECWFAVNYQKKSGLQVTAKTLRETATHGWRPDEEEYVVLARVYVNQKAMLLYYDSKLSVEEVLLEAPMESCHTIDALFDALQGLYGRELYIFDGKIYERVTNTELIEIVQGNLAKQILRRIPNIRKVQDVRVWLVGHPRVPKLSGREVYVGNRYLIPFANGIYDVEGARFLPFSPQQIVFYQLDAEYQADCEGLPPRFARFSSDNFGCDEVCTELLLEILGYICMPSNDAKKFFVFGTARDSGKSLLANFCSEVLGREMVSRVGLHNMRQRFYLNETVGKRANFSMDLKESVLREDDVEVIKTMSGECEIEAEGKYEDPRMAFSTCKLVCGTNHPVRLKRGDTALWERMVVMPFTRRCPEKKKDIRLLDKLLEERDAIMTCAAWAATRLYQRNFVFVEPPMAKRLKGGWIAGSGGCVEHFIEEYCEVTGDGNDFIESRDLYDQYAQCTLDPVSENQFMYQVRQQFVPESPKKRKRIGNRIATGVFGLKWKED